MCEPVLFWLGSELWRGQMAMLSCHPPITPVVRPPGSVRPTTVCPGAVLSSSSSRARRCPQDSGLAGFTFWQLTTDSGP